MNIIPIEQWSISKSKVASQCMFRAQLAYGQKIPEPERPLPPGKTEHANDRGSRIHDAAEKYVMGKGPMLPEMKHFAAEFDSLKQLHAEGKVSLEGEWAMDREWNPVSWYGEWQEDTVGLVAKRFKGADAPRKADKLPNRGADGETVMVDKKIYIWVPAWLRLKLDAIVFLSDVEAVVIDYKTGKKFGNEIGHAEQTQLYQMVSFLRYPQLEIIHTELWYLDLPGDEGITQNTFNRQQGLRFKHGFTQKGLKLTTATEFPANPSIFTCKWCPYGRSGTGHCQRGG